MSRSLETVQDIPNLEVGGAGYDLALFASGYEPRSRAFARSLPRSIARRVVVLGFDELRDVPSRRRNDDFFASRWPGSLVPITADDDAVIYQTLAATHRPAKGSPLRLLVDYSSMSRGWYSSVLNWCRYSLGEEAIEVDFVYSVGAYPSELPPLVIDGIVSVPGFEGVTGRSLRTSVLFGLGFAGAAALCVAERVEADELVAFLPDESFAPAYSKRVMRNNLFFLQQYIDREIRTPLDRVSSAYRTLANLVSYRSTDHDVSLALMGPKPHVLAGLLVGVRFEEVPCLWATSKRDRPDEVKAVGAIVVTRTRFGSAEGASTRVAHSLVQ